MVKKEKLIGIGEAAEMLGISLNTLRRWDASGYLKPKIRTAGDQRRYSVAQLNFFLSDLVRLGFEWAENQIEVPSQTYCERSSIFQARLDKLSKQLFDMSSTKELAPLVIAVCGEIGNNSFDHNLGNWPDVAGVYFAYDTSKRIIVLADRGRGILATLKQVRPTLTDDSQALRVAFTEILSGRAPEARGNGLKFVRKVAMDYPIHVAFQSGSAKLEVEQGDRTLELTDAAEPVRGCFAVVRF